MRGRVAIPPSLGRKAIHVPRGRRSPSCPPIGSLRLRWGEAADADRVRELVLVLPAPGGEVGLDHEIEDMIFRIEPDWCARERLLEVHVPRAERPIGSVPERPVRVRRAGTGKHEHGVVAPASLAELPVEGEPLAVRERPADLRAVASLHGLLDDGVGCEEERAIEASESSTTRTGFSQRSSPRRK